MRRTLAVLLVAGLLAGACGSAGGGADRDGDGDDRDDGAASSTTANGNGHGAGDEHGGEGGNTGSDTRPADCDPARPHETALGPQTFDLAGQAREYLLALPDGYDGTTAVPLVLDFHGFSNTKEGQDTMTGMSEQGTARGYAVVTPDALGQPQEWNAFSDPAKADDFAFVAALVAELGERLCLDPDRVYAAGHSNGSAFTGFLVCREAPRLAAVAMVSAFVPRTCPVEAPIPAVMAVHGSADPLVPYGGGSVGGGPVGIPPALDTLEAYGRAYDCPAPRAEDQPVAGFVERRRYAGCAHESEVLLYTVVGGGHEWPNDQRFSATEAILDFFDRH